MTSLTDYAAGVVIDSLVSALSECSVRVVNSLGDSLASYKAGTAIRDGSEIIINSAKEVTVSKSGIASKLIFSGLGGDVFAVEIISGGDVKLNTVNLSAGGYIDVGRVSISIGK